MKTPHIYSSPKIIVTVFFRKKMKSHENFIFWLSLARKTCTEQVVTRR